MCQNTGMEVLVLLKFTKATLWNHVCKEMLVLGKSNITMKLDVQKITNMLILFF